MATFAGADIHKKGTIVLGTVEGDLHDIGKNLVGMMLGSYVFNIVDVVVDVSADSFASAAKESMADIVAMSGLLTTTITYFPTVIEALEKAGLKNKVKVVLAGPSYTGAGLYTVATLVQSEEFGWDYFGRLYENEMQIVKCNRDLNQAIADGELWMGITTDFMVRAQKTKDASLPIDYVFPDGSALIVRAHG